MEYIRQRALKGDFLAGAWCNLASPISTEIIGTAGYDWILVDQEHGPGDNWTLMHQLQAVSRFPAAVVVRLPWVDRVCIKRTLDLGAAGIMIPYVQTAGEAKEVVKLAKYMPEGERGIAGSPRCMDYTTNFKQYFASANQKLITVVQIETAGSVENAEAIAAVPGVDVLFVGPLDLSYSVGKPEWFADPSYVELLARVAKAAKKHGKAAGILLPKTDLIPQLKALGYTFIACGSDGGAVLAAMTATLKALRA
jgi:2-keto-3-deoxy-L-rhamnonate aldolase RhmA